MAEGPVKASAVAPSTKKSAKELAREKVGKTVRARQAQREAVRQAGGDVRASSDDLAARLEQRLDKRTKAVIKSRRKAKDAVAKRLTEKGR